MITSKDLLIEIGIEELPHSFILDAIHEFRRLFIQCLKGFRIEFGEVMEYSTPRRLALVVGDVKTTQRDFKEEKRGPSFEKAFLSNGTPSNALLGFLKSNGIELKDTVIKESGNGKYIFLLKDIKGESTESLLPKTLDDTLKAMSFPKAMRWEASGFAFARPVRWIVYLFGNRVIHYEKAGITSSKLTFGHRFLGNKKIELNNPLEYEEKLMGSSVIAERKKRKEHIKKQIDAVVIPMGLEVPEVAHGLYDSNTDLTEYPNVVMCRFEEHFLNLPQEVLMSEMIEHQYYFPLIYRDTKKLSNYFIVISNIMDNSRSLSGFERVLKARFDDGKFFYSEDSKKDLSTYLQKLKTLTFHEKLGSMVEKVFRISKISKVLADLLLVDEKVRENIDQVASLCKNDLVTSMVYEFPNLQGVMGYYYALSSGYPAEVALGIKEHYYPRFAQDVLPTKIEGAVVGIADRLDTIMGIFSTGAKPGGSKDPFALRRKVFGIIKVIIFLKLNFSLHQLIDRVVDLYGGEQTFVKEVESFIKNRVRSVFAEMGFSHDEIEASLSEVLEDIYEAYRRILELHNLRGNKDFEDLLISFKRMGNIIKEERDFIFSEELLKEKEERELYDFFINVGNEIIRNINERNYGEVYRILSTFKPYVDNFFDHVLVMDENLDLRRNRMGLLRSIIDVFSSIIDFSKIVIPGE